MILALPFQLLAAALNAMPPSSTAQSDAVQDTIWLDDTDRSGWYILAERGPNDDAYICSPQPVSLEAHR